VHLLHFRSPFSRELDDLRQLVRAEWSGTVYRTQSIKKDYRRLIGTAPEGGFSHARSCYNCRYLLLAKAKRYMERIGAAYIVTGEVLTAGGPSSDDLIEMTARLGMRSRILRPLLSSIGADAPRDLTSWARRKGRVRSTKSKHALLGEAAADLGMDPRDPMRCECRCKFSADGFGKRVASLFGEAGFTLNALRLLDFELFYKVGASTKIVLARDEAEKRELQNLFLPEDFRVYPATPHGPMTLVRTDWDAKSPADRREVIDLAARITATFVDSAGPAAIPIYYRQELDDETLLLNARPFQSADEIAAIGGVEMIPLATPQALVA